MCAEKKKNKEKSRKNALRSHRGVGYSSSRDTPMTGEGAGRIPEEGACAYERDRERVVSDRARERRNERRTSIRAQKNSLVLYSSSPHVGGEEEEEEGKKKKIIRVNRTGFACRIPVYRHRIFLRTVHPDSRKRSMLPIIVVVIADRHTTTSV